MTKKQKTESEYFYDAMKTLCQAINIFAWLFFTGLVLALICFIWR